MKSVMLRRITLVGLLILGFAGPIASQTAAPGRDLSRAKSLGSPQAPITLEVFADYQCTYCQQFYLAVTVKLIPNYVDKGKVYLVHRDLPIHPNAPQAARWAGAAALAGKFEEAEKVLYEQQDDWGPTGKIDQALANALSAADMKKIREIETAQSARIDAAVQSDRALGKLRGVTGTPTVFMTHHGKTEMLPQGGVSYDLLRQLLDYYLQH